MSKGAPAPATGQGMQGANDTSNDSVTRDLSRKLAPRYQRLLAALLDGPVMRESVDRIAGTSNGPHCIYQLRALELQISCERVESLDRDGRPCRPGRYRLQASSRRYARQLLANSSTLGGA